MLIQKQGEEHKAATKEKNIRCNITGE